MTTAVEPTVEIPEALGFFMAPDLGELRYRVAYGGRGSAKSWTVARVLLVLGASRPLRVLCAREFQSSIQESVLHLLAEQVDAVGLSGFYHVGARELTGANGTEFIFKGLRRNVAEIKSTEGVDICWIEEAQAVSEESWRVLVPTIRKPGSEIWVVFNPDMETDPTYARFVADPPARSIVRQVGYQDNPWLPDVLRDEAAQLRERDPEAYATVWGGRPWSRSDAQVLRGKWVTDEFTPGEGWDGPYFGADWGFARDPSVLVKLWRHADTLWVEHEAGGIELDMDQVAEVFAGVPGAREHMIRADNARPETINEMRRRRFRIEAAPKWDGSVKDGIAHLRSYARIVIHPRCKRATDEARLWRYKTNDVGDVLPVLVDANNHVWDAVRYALSPLIRQHGGTFTQGRARYG